MSSAPQWTEEQRRSIETVGHHLLVSAAAGSGKTAVLAERCAHLVCDTENRCDVTHLLVVTFTRAAAAEMRERIEAALRRRLNSATDAEQIERLTRQTRLLGNASIGTLHAFCIDLLREHFQLLGLDPAFEILDEDQSVLLRRQIAEQLFAERYDSENDDAFRRFVDDYGRKDDDDLIGKVLSAQALMESVIDPAAWLAEARKRIADAANLPLAQSELGRELLGEIDSLLKELHGLCDSAETTVQRFPEMKAYRPFLVQMRGLIDHWQTVLGKSGYSALSVAVLQELPQAPRMSAKLVGKEECKSALDVLKKAMGPDGVLACRCRFTEAEWRHGAARTIEPTEVFLDLVSEFAHRFAAAKRAQRVLDFGDLERMTLTLLDDQDEPTNVARLCQKRYAHVLVDEYQDINEVQERILQRLSRDDTATSGNLFCVGDVKQSIYRFRLAQPKNFMDRAERFGRDAPRDGGQVIDLHTNFRSRPAVLECLNALFERLMIGDTMEINYDHTHRLGAPPATMYDCLPCKDSPVELHLLTDTSQDETRAEREGAFVASQIQKLIGGQTQIVDRATGEPRKLKYSDIAVLLRSLKGKADDFAAALRAAGVPVFSDSNSGFFKTQEVRDLRALLAVLDNLRQDVPLAAVLRSPLLRLPHPEDAMASARIAYPPESTPFHAAVEKHSAAFDTDLRLAMKTLSAWRSMANQRPIDETLQTILGDSGYLSFIAALNDGQQRVANVMAFVERARCFCQSTQRQDLSRFCQFLDALALESDIGQPSIAAAAGDAVRITTVHRAKGLEFAIVFVPDLGKKHSMQSTAGSILVDRKGYVGLKVVDPELRVQYPSIAQLMAREAIRRQTLAEELRVLYVAATRACERLILVGSCTCGARDGWKGRFSQHVGGLPINAMMSAVTPLEWIASAGYAVATALPQLITIHEPDESISANSNPPREHRTPLQEQLIARQPLASTFHSDAADAIVHRLGRMYCFQSAVDTPAVKSVTQLATAHETALPPRLDRGLHRPVDTITVEMSAAEIGDATHLAMEHINLKAAVDCDSVRQQLRVMVERALLSQQQMDSINVDHICWFLGSDLGVLMRSNPAAVRRERTLYFAIGDSPERRDRTMVRGRMDVLLALADRCVIIDYKTDRTPAELLDAQVEHHRKQLTLYAEALHRIVCKPVQAYLAFLQARQNRVVVQ